MLQGLCSLRGITSLRISGSESEAVNSELDLIQTAVLAGTASLSHIFRGSMPLPNAQKKGEAGLDTLSLSQSQSEGHTAHLNAGSLYWCL